MDTNIIIQYTVVCLLCLGALIWIVVKMVRSAKGKNSGGCCGCSMSDSCAKREKNGCPSAAKQDKPDSADQPCEMCSHCKNSRDNK